MATRPGYEHIVALLADPASGVREHPALAEAVWADAAGLEMPVPVRQVQPSFSDEALKRKVVGTVEIQIVVLKNGEVRPVRLLESLELELDRRAIEAVRGWRFRPGRIDGEPVDVLADIVVSFNIL